MKKILLAVSIILLLQAAINSQEKDKKIYLKFESENYVSKLAVNLSALIWNFDLESVNKILDMEIEIENIAGIFIYTEPETFWIAKYKNDKNEKITIDMTNLNFLYAKNILEKNSIKVIKKDVIHYDQNIGSVAVYIKQ